MYDFKTFAQANVDLIFKDFDRLPQPGEEVFARQFTLQLGGGPSVWPHGVGKAWFSGTAGHIPGAEYSQRFVPSDAATTMFFFL